MLLNYTKKAASEHVKFISYTGKYPCLCSGTLTLNIDGEEVKFGYEFPMEDHPELNPPFWQSGGTTNWHLASVTTGEWIIDTREIPNRYQKYADEIDWVFNANVPHGCCGGCL